MPGYLECGAMCFFCRASDRTPAGIPLDVRGFASLPLVLQGSHGMGIIALEGDARWCTGGLTLRSNRPTVREEMRAASFRSTAVLLCGVPAGITDAMCNWGLGRSYCRFFSEKTPV